MLKNMMSVISAESVHGGGAVLCNRIAKSAILPTEAFMALEIRIAQTADIDMLMETRLKMLCEVNALSHGEDFSPELVAESRRYFVEGDQTTVVAEDAGKTVACASLSYITVMPTFDHPTGKRAHLMNVWTASEYRRKRIARALVRRLIDEAKERGVTEISLDAMESGQPLYEALGFRASAECMTLCLKKVETGNRKQLLKTFSILVKVFSMNQNFIDFRKTFQ